jgi:cysteinyl-tRNA synthetase
LIDHGYPWRDEDPLINDYRKWELGDSSYSKEINSILYARQKAWREKKKKEAGLLREDLSKLGVVIRDEKNSQYV